MTSQISMAMLLVASYCFNCWSKGSAGFCGDVKANDRASTDLGEPAKPREASGEGASGHDMEGYVQRDAARHFLQLVYLWYRQESAPPDTDRLVKLCDVMTCAVSDEACVTLATCLC